MSSKENTQPQTRIGPGFLGMLTLLFIGLKLTGHIDWSWLWVLAPLWIPLAVLAVLFLLLGAATFAVHVLEKHERRGRGKK